MFSYNSYNFSGITCRPSRVTKGTQTESVSQPVIVPVMVPIYLPVPMQMYQRPLPVPVPMPLPIPGNYQIFPLNGDSTRFILLLREWNQGISILNFGGKIKKKKILKATSGSCPYAATYSR